MCLTGLVGSCCKPVSLGPWTQCTVAIVRLVNNIICHKFFTTTTIDRSNAEGESISKKSYSAGIYLV